MPGQKKVEKFYDWSGKLGNRVSFTCPARCRAEIVLGQPSLELIPGIRTVDLSAPDLLKSSTIYSIQIAENH